MKKLHSARLDERLAVAPVKEQVTVGRLVKVVPRDVVQKLHKALAPVLELGPEQDEEDQLGGGPAGGGGGGRAVLAPATPGRPVLKTF